MKTFDNSSDTTNWKKTADSFNIDAFNSLIESPERKKHDREQLERICANALNRAFKKV